MVLYHILKIKKDWFKTAAGNNETDKDYYYEKNYFTIFISPAFYFMRKYRF